MKPLGWNALFQKFQFVPRKASEAALSVGTAVETAASSTAAAPKDYTQPSTSGEQQKFLPGQKPQVQQITAMSGNTAAAAG